MFTEDERRIYGPYFNGAKEVLADPLALNRKIKALMGGNPAKLVEDYNSGIAEVAFEAGERFFAAVREAFGLVAFDPETGDGMTESDCLKCWNDFQSWLKKKDVTDRNSPTSVPPLVPGGLPRAPSRSTCSAPST